MTKRTIHIVYFIVLFGLLTVLLGTFVTLWLGGNETAGKGLIWLAISYPLIGRAGYEMLIQK